MLSRHGRIELTRAGDRLWASAAYLVAAVSIWTMLSHSWVPIDEGTIALSARMVRAGFIPHADFAYPYTGALAFWNALAIKFTGDSMLTPRYALFAAFLLWLPAIWSLARRFAPAPQAAAAVVLAAWWSLLIYPAAMPTWYVLFLTTWALVALARWNDTGARVWLMMAGIAVGLAIVVRQTGILTLVGAGFGVIAIHQDREREFASGSATAPSETRVADPLVIVLLAIAMLVPIGLIVWRGLLAGEVPTIALPLAATIAALAWRERGLHANLGESRRALIRAWGTLAAYAFVAPALLLVFYASHGVVGALVDGVVGGTMRTAAVIDTPMVPAITILVFAIPLSLVAVAALRLPPVTWAVDTAIAGAVAIGVGVAAMQFTNAYLAVWYFAVVLLPVGVLIAARSAMLSATRAGTRAGGVAPGSGLVLAIAAATALLAANQVPYALPNYFGYVAPLAFVLMLVVAARAGVSRQVMIPAAILLVFGGWFHRIGSVGTVGVAPVWWDDAHRLPGDHGKLLVTASDSAQQSRVIALITSHASPESFAAGPELIHLFALAGTRRVVSQPYLLAPDAQADSSAISMAIDTLRIRVVVINDAPRFLAPVSASARTWIAARYPNSERVGDMDVRWR